MTIKLLHFALLFLAAVPIWIILRRPWKRCIPHEIALGLFVAYMAALLTMALEGSWSAPSAMLSSARERLGTMEQIHLHPFDTIRQQFRLLPDEESLTQLVGNTLLFLPWGFFLPLLWQKLRSIPVITGLCLLLTCFIEITQLFIHRTVDVDDLLLNFLGSMSGAGLWLICRRWFPAMEILSCSSPDIPGRS